MKMKIRDLTHAFNRRFGTQKNQCQIKSTLAYYHILCGRKPKDRLVNRLRLYTEEQIRFIHDNYAGRSVAGLTALFNERFDADKTARQIKTFVSNRGLVSGRTGRFEKGRKPWNTGTKGQGLTGANPGSFKKGTVPQNRRAVGAERIDSKDGFVLVKIAERDPYTGFSTRFKHKHVYTWEKEHGPVPDGYVVAFKDGDKNNCEDIDNLMIITRAELLNLNRHGYRNAPDKLKPSVLALSTLQVKTWAREKEL